MLMCDFEEKAKSKMLVRSCGRAQVRTGTIGTINRDPSAESVVAGIGRVPEGGLRLHYSNLAGTAD